MSSPSSYVSYANQLISSSKRGEQALGALLLQPTQAMHMYGLMKTIDVIFHEHEIHYFAWAGTLLGCVRHQGLIPWDDDLDVLIHETHVPALRSEKVLRALNAKNINILEEHHKDGTIYHAYVESRSSYLSAKPIVVTHQQLFRKNTSPYNQGRPFYSHSNACIDIFICVDAEKQKQRAWVPTFKKYRGKDHIYVDEVYPIRRLSFGTFSINAFAKSEDYLLRLYGQECLTTAVVGLRWCHDSARIAHLKTLQREISDAQFKDAYSETLCALQVPCIDIQDHWNSYYSHHHHHSHHSQPPSDFAKFVASYMSKKKRTVIDIGCGTGRDGRYFASLGMEVLGVDPSFPVVKEEEEQPGWTRSRLNCLEIRDVFQDYEVIYMRFFLHAIDTMTQDMLFRDMTKYVVPGSLLCIEARSMSDEMHSVGTRLSSAESVTDHYRRFLHYDELCAQIQSLGFQVLYSVHAQGLARHGDEDPHVIRIIAQKEEEENLSLLVNEIDPC
jgi:2-polyprenyl-3-methyl-5-hydroxy-6-metoxy-1,4-benzoquinol methylase